MSKYVNVPTGDYTIKVRKGGTIFLDAAFKPYSVDQNNQPVPEEYGKVVITGNLEVQGYTTTVTSTELAINDNTITVNSGETGAGVTLNEAGLQVDRGTLSDAFVVFDEAVGYFVLRDETDLLGIKTNLVSSGNDDLNLAPGTNYAIVTPTDYLSGVGFNNLTPDEVKYVPNIEWVNGKIDFQLTQTRQPRIQDGTFGAQETFVEVQDDTTTTVPSRAVVGIDGIITTEFYEEYTNIFDVRISGNVVGARDDTQKLILSTSKFAGVEVNDSFTLTTTDQHIPDNEPGYIPSINPPRPGNGTRLYSKLEGPGGTGVFFVNQQVVEDVGGTPTVTKASNRDELISKNKAILYSMLF